MPRRLVHYHFGVQLTLLVIGLVGLFLLPDDLMPWSPHSMHVLWVALIVQFGLKRKVNDEQGFPVLQPWEKSN